MHKMRPTLLALPSTNVFSRSKRKRNMYTYLLRSMKGAKRLMMARASAGVAALTVGMMREGRSACSAHAEGAFSPECALFMAPAIGEIRALEAQDGARFQCTQYRLW